MHGRMSVTVRMLRDYLFYLSILSLVFVPVATATASTDAVLSSPEIVIDLEHDRWWVGYCYLGPEKAGEQIADLVSGYIERVPIGLPDQVGVFVVEWTCIVTYYNKPGYWVQGGWGVILTSDGIIPFFYAERMDKKTEPEGNKTVQTYPDPIPEIGYAYKCIVCRIYRSDDYQVIIQKEGLSKCSIISSTT